MVMHEAKWILCNWVLFEGGSLLHHIDWIVLCEKREQKSEVWGTHSMVSNWNEVVLQNRVLKNY